MKGMIERNSFYIITLLITAALLIPLFFRQPVENTISLDNRTVSISIVKSLPILLILLFISLHGTTENREHRGWKRPAAVDIPFIILFLTFTTILSFIFPAADGSYSVSIHGVKGILLICIFALVTALSEELFFRSWLINGMKSAGWPGWLVFSLPVLFFVSLLVWQGWSGFIFAAISGSLYTLYFMRRGRLFPLFFSHAIHNALALILMSVR